MAKLRVKSLQVSNELKKLGAGVKRNIRAFRVTYGSSERFFEEAKDAFRYAAVECTHSDEIYEIYENVGGEEFVLMAAYEKGASVPIRRGRRPRVYTPKIKQETQQERWERAYQDTSVGILIRRYKKNDTVSVESESKAS